jgi:hypothetical protein
MTTKRESRMVFIGGNYQGTFEVDICSICKGHLPVTKKVADQECVGHGGVSPRLLSLGEQYPQFKESKKKVLRRKKKSQKGSANQVNP